MEKYEVRRKDGTVKYYDFLSPFHDGFAAVKENGKWGFIDVDGNEICPIQYEFPYSFKLHRQDPSAFWEGYAVVGVPKGKFLRFGYINTKGEEACPLIYTSASDFINGIAIVRDESNKWAVINKNFEQITPRTYDRIYDFYFGYAVVELNGLFGFINKNGEEMCEIKYKYMSCFGEQGFARIEIPGTVFDRTYWIDTQGKEYYLYFDSDEMQPLT